MESVEELVAQSLKIDLADVSDDLEYQSVAAWSSLAHVALMIRLEQSFDLRIGPDDVLDLTSVQRIRRFVDQRSKKQPPLPHGRTDNVAARLTSEQQNGQSLPKIHRGLTEVYIDRTTITEIDGAAGRLLHRGYSMHDLANSATFEEAAYLLLRGELPNPKELESFRRELNSFRSLPDNIVEMIRLQRAAKPVDVLRTMVSALAAFGSDQTAGDRAEPYCSGLQLISQLPMIAGMHHRLRNNLTPTVADPTITHAAHCLQQLTGEMPKDTDSRHLEQDLISHLDHGANPSTFTARIVTGTEADIYAAFTAAIAAFSGPLHGGAIADVMEMVREIGRPELAAGYVERRVASARPIPGFGHRVYRTADPRAVCLRQLCKQQCEEAGRQDLYEILEAVAAAMGPYHKHGVAPNVDLYGGVFYFCMGVPEDMFVPFFIMARSVGWLAQIMEQQSNNVLIRPRLSYTGPAYRVMRPQ